MSATSNAKSAPLFVYSIVTPKFKGGSDEVDHLEIWMRATLIGHDQSALYAEAIAMTSRANSASDLLAGLQSIVDRADNGELGTSKVQDMRRIAADLLAKHGGAS